MSAQAQRRETNDGFGRRWSVRSLRHSRRAVQRAYGAIAVGFVLVLVGFILILYAVWSAGTIPINNYTLLGVAMAGIGVAVGAVGLDRGIEVKG